MRVVHVRPRCTERADDNGANLFDLVHLFDDPGIAQMRPTCMKRSQDTNSDAYLNRCSPQLVGPRREHCCTTRTPKFRRLAFGAVAPKVVSRYAGSFATAVLAAYKAAKRYTEGSCKCRHDALVDGFARLEALERAREDSCGFHELVDAVVACDAKAEDAGRQRFDR